MIFIFLEDLIFEEFDDSTYFSATSIDMMNQPEETIRFDKRTIISDFINENSRWIQAKNQTIRVQNNVTQRSGTFLATRYDIKILFLISKKNILFSKSDFVRTKKE